MPSGKWGAKVRRTDERPEALEGAQAPAGDDKGTDATQGGAQPSGGLVSRIKGKLRGEA